MNPPETVKVYRQVGIATRECDFDTHKVPVVSVKTLRLTDGTHVYNNGYETRILPVYEDYQGRRYQQRVSIDYHNNITYFRTGVNQFFRPVYKTSLTGTIRFDKV